MDDESQEDQESHGAEQEDVAAQRKVLGRQAVDLDQGKKDTGSSRKRKLSRKTAGEEGH